MHLLYADEAGSLRDANHRHFVLAGISAFERRIYWISQQLDQIAARFDPSDPSSVELHGSPMLNGKGFWRQFPLPDRIQAIRDALNVISQNHYYRVFGVAINKRSAAQQGLDTVEMAFEQISSRFDQYLMRLHRKGDTQRGVIVFDKTREESAIQGFASDYRSIGHSWGTIRNLAEVPLFLDSRISRLIQLADLVAYGIFRNFERGDGQFFQIMQPNFDEEGGAVHGLYHFY